MGRNPIGDLVGESIPVAGFMDFAMPRIIPIPMRLLIMDSNDITIMLTQINKRGFTLKESKNIFTFIYFSFPSSLQP
jgi:hypothetical protein